jgi:hypothetical protein
MQLLSSRFNLTTAMLYDWLLSYQRAFEILRLNLVHGMQTELKLYGVPVAVSEAEIGENISI